MISFTAFKPIVRPMQQQLVQTLLFLLCFNPLYAQVLTSVVLDSATQKPIPFATIQFKDKGMITNEEGRFTFIYSDTIEASDTLKVSCIGYQSIAKPIHDFDQNAIFLSPKSIALQEVIVSNKNYSPAEIIKKVRENIPKNFEQGITKQRFFLRENYKSFIQKTNYSILESTIPALNRQFLDSMVRIMPKKDNYYTEVLGDLYQNNSNDGQKALLIKASELYDKNTRMDYDHLEQRFNDIIKKNIKTDSYFKVKSGLLGTKMDLDEFLETEVDSTDTAALQHHVESLDQQKQEEKKNFANYKKHLLKQLFGNLPVLKGSYYTVLWKPGRYHFTMEAFTYIGENPLYVLQFSPKGSEDYKGKLYVNADDFALIKMEFENVKPLKKFSFFGFSTNHYLSKGSILFGKNQNDKYALRYYLKENGRSYGFNRPVKIIEKNKNVKGRRKQNELHLKIDAAFTGKSTYEMVVFDTTPINAQYYQGITEHNEVLPQYMPNYDPTYWQGYTIMEPNTAIKEFTSTVELKP